MKITQARVAHLYDTLANWAAANPLLYKGEIALIKDGNNVRFKVGDGGTDFNNLPFVDDIFNSFFVSVAVPSTNPGPPVGNRIYETSTPGNYVHFLDQSNAAIVVNANEYVRLIDTGSYFVKVIVPLSTGSLATAANVFSNMMHVFNTDYESGTQAGSNTPVDKSTSLFSNSLPVSSDWYVDMTLSFDTSRLKGIKVKGVFTGDFDFALVTIDAAGQLTIVDQDTDSVTSGNITTIGRSGYHDESLPTYIALRDATGHPVRLNSGAPSGNQVWQFSGSTGALVSKLTTTDINYWIELFDEGPLQSKLTKDIGIVPIRAVTGATPAVGLKDNTLLVTSIVFGTSIVLPRFGLPAGKVFTVKYAAGSGTITVTGADGATIDGGANSTLTAIGQVKHFQTDGSNYWIV